MCAITVMLLPTVTGCQGVEGQGVHNHSDVAAHCDRMLEAMGGDKVCTVTVMLLTTATGCQGWGVG